MPDGSSLPQKTPENPIYLPSNDRELLNVVTDLVQTCRATSSQRASYYRQLASWTETGRQDGSKSKLNLLFNHIDRLASYLFSPVELKFSVQYRFDHPGEQLKRARVASSILTDDWESSSTDMVFGQGVFESLKYGACFLKQWPEKTGSGFTHSKSLVMPWNFGVYAEYIDDLDRQPAMCETVTLTLPEVWKIIEHLPNARQLFQRIKSNAQSGGSSESPESVFHQVFSTSTLQLGGIQNASPRPGGIINLNSQANYPASSVITAADLVKMHELYVWDGAGRTTIQLIEPDILIQPLTKKINILAYDRDSGSVAEGLASAHPYTLIQPNKKHGNIWGRSELEDLMEVQGWISTTCNDLERMFNLQIDKILAFDGDGVQDEQYDQMRLAGYVNLGAGGGVKDLTPPFPAEGLPLLNQLIQFMEMIGGMDNLLSGRGEPGVRAGNHAGMLMKTASPRLRDRALAVERQCAQAADFWLRVCEAKDGRAYWTNGTTPEAQKATEFLLDDLPDDRRVTVHSHSGSPIFMGDHEKLMTWGLGAGVVTPEYVAEHLDFPDKDSIYHSLRERAAAQEKLLADLKQRDPEAYAKVLQHSGGRGHK